MKEDIESALQVIEEDYNVCFKLIRKIYDYLETFGVKEFNQYSTYKWSFDRDKTRKYSYLCIRSGSSLNRKCMVKRRPYLEDADLYKWVEQKDLIEEALDEAYQYIHKKVTDVKSKIEEMKETVEDYAEKLEDVTREYEEIKPRDAADSLSGDRKSNGETAPGLLKTSREVRS